MARLVKPQVVARIDPPDQGMAGPTGPPPEPSPEQLEALDSFVEGIEDEALTNLLGGAEEVVIRVRKARPGEVWVRVD